MITVKVSSGIPNDLFLEIRFYMASIARKISSEVKDFLFIQLKKEGYFCCDEAIFVYGFNEFFPEQMAKDSVFEKLQEKIEAPVIIVDSICTRLGCKEQTDFYFEVMSKSAQHQSPLNDLRGLDTNWNIQNNLVGSNIAPKDMGDFFVEVTAPPSELEFMMDVIWALKINKLLKMSIWPKIALG